MSSTPQSVQMNRDRTPVQVEHARVPSSATDATSPTVPQRGQGRRVPRMMLKQGSQVGPPRNRARTRRSFRQCTQGSILPGAHWGQIGPSGVRFWTSRECPHRMHASFASGRRRRQVPQ